MATGSPQFGHSGAIISSCPCGLRYPARELAGNGRGRPCPGEEMARRWFHETTGHNVLPLLARLLRGYALECAAARLRHDADGGLARARRTARLLFRTGRLRNLYCGRTRIRSRLLSGRPRDRFAVPQRPPYRVEERLAAPAGGAVLKPIDTGGKWGESI